MHIALDGSDLTTQKLDGTTIYVRELLPKLASVLLEHGNEVTVFLPKEIDKSIFPAVVKLNIIKGRRFWTQTSLSRALFRVRPDLLFLPIQTVPLYRPANLKVVATVHDLDFLEFPEMFNAGNLFLLRWFTRVVARNATRIIAVSENTKKKILQHYKRDEKDISVVYHGYDKKVFRPPVSQEEREAAIINLQKNYNIPANGILFVGAMQPRKNILGLIEAFEILKKKKVADNLVIVSGNGWREKPILERISKSPFAASIYLVRNVNTRDLTSFYWNARVFVLPSFAEGFGLPILESMACGTPVVTSNVSAPAEIGSSGSTKLVDPRDSQAIASGIEEILTNTDFKNQLIKNGLKRAGEFCWEKCAAETALVIEKAAQKG